MKKVLSILFLSSILLQSSFAQISGVINIYTKVTNIDLPCNKITVSSSTGFVTGDTVLLIQMQGASAVQTNGNTFGNLTAINNAGNYEFAEISSISGNDIYLKHSLLKTYTVSGSVQLISVPQYTNVDITGTLTAQPWNGNTGGVLVFEASGTVTMSADIDVSQMGFRGGSINPSGGDCFTSSSNTYFYGTASVQAGRKGEGVAILPAGSESGRGKFANGGGGGNSHNTGGGGGANYGAGGDGGRKSGSCNAIAPDPFGIGGIGFTTTQYSNALQKIFMGGGGGAGQQNNLRAHPGGNGGGIVIIRAAALNGNGFSINNYGESVPVLPFDNGDGNGAGGAGGTVLLSVSSFTSPLNVKVNGGKGGNTDNTGAAGNRDFGPGGGGGGGLIWFSLAALPGQVTNTFGGGLSGISAYSNTNYGAAPGSTGATLTDLILPRGSTIFNQTCISLPVELLKFTGKFIQQKVKLDWITTSEKNNSFFTIERTADFQTFKVVGKVQGSVNSNSEISYFIYDHEPEDGISYYRLSQTDLDGTSKIRGIVSITNYSTDKLIHKIYPVPFTDELTLELNSKASSSEKLSVTVYNTLGEVVFQSEFPKAEKIDLSLSELPSAMYTLMIQSEEGIEITKIIK